MSATKSQELTNSTRESHFHYYIVFFVSCARSAKEEMRFVSLSILLDISDFFFVSHGALCVCDRR